MEKFGRLTVKYKAGQVYNPITKRKGSILYYCECDCGSYNVCTMNSLKTGNTSSCGCLRGDFKLTHGGNKSKEYQSWIAMKNRCLNAKQNDYVNYGGRGIKICNRWLSSFDNFIEDMGERPEGKTLDRIDNDGNYEPNNCKWSTYSEQLSNRRKYKIIK